VKRIIEDLKDREILSIRGIEALIETIGTEGEIVWKDRK
jgi:hypothetical protein